MKTLFYSLMLFVGNCQNAPTSISQAIVAVQKDKVVLKEAISALHRLEENLEYTQRWEHSMDEVHKATEKKNAAWANYRRSLVTYHKIKKRGAAKPKGPSRAVVRAKILLKANQAQKNYQ